MVTIEMTTLIQVDSRGRLSLGSLAQQTTYLAHGNDDGSIVLEPAVVLTETEARLRTQPELFAEVERRADRPEGAGRPRTVREPR